MSNLLLRYSRCRHLHLSAPAPCDLAFSNREAMHGNRLWQRRTLDLLFSEPNGECKMNRVTPLVASVALAMIVTGCASQPGQQNPGGLSNTGMGAIIGTLGARRSRRPDRQQRQGRADRSSCRRRPRHRCRLLHGPPESRAGIQASARKSPAARCSCNRTPTRAWWSP